MKTISLLMLFFIVIYSQAQDTTAAWIKKIDSLAYKAVYSKKQIPQEFYSALNIKDTKDIADPKKPYISGCIAKDNLPFKRLNWIAKDKLNHWVISVSHGGKMSGTDFYFIDKEKSSINVNRVQLMDDNPEKLNFKQCIRKIKAGQYKFAL